MLFCSPAAAKCAPISRFFSRSFGRSPYRRDRDLGDVRQCVSRGHFCANDDERVAKVFSCVFFVLFFSLGCESSDLSASRRVAEGDKTLISSPSCARAAPLAALFHFRSSWPRALAANAASTAKKGVLAQENISSPCVAVRRLHSQRFWHQRERRNYKLALQPRKKNRSKNVKV